jgi:UDP-glucuronate decarboxylase
MQSSKRFLVTGGAGFVGSHLCDALFGMGHKVLCVDNHFTGRRRNIEHLTTVPHFEELRQAQRLP